MRHNNTLLFAAVLDQPTARFVPVFQAGVRIRRYTPSPTCNITGHCKPCLRCRPIPRHVPPGLRADLLSESMVTLAHDTWRAAEPGLSAGSGARPVWTTRAVPRSEQGVAMFDSSRDNDAAVIPPAGDTVWPGYPTTPALTDTSGGFARIYGPRG